MGSNMRENDRVSAYTEIISNGIITPELTVDLRSDTLTKPCHGMRQAMCNAIVGDDVRNEDPTIKELESRVAKICGKDAGLFVTSGSMGNLISAMVHCSERGAEMICGDQSHIFRYEQGSASQIGGIHSNQIETNEDGTFDIDGVIERIRSDDIHFPKTQLICVENTHNQCGGRILPLEWIDELAEVSQEYKIPLHMDGARLFNASVASGRPVSRIVRDFDSVSICFSKGLGAPIGSVIAGDEEFIAKARRIRMALGGGMRQCGILGAAGIYCLDNMIDRLKDDHDNAQTLTKIINGMNSPNVFVNAEIVETNIILLNVKGIPIKQFCTRLAVVEENEKKSVGALISVKCLPWSETVTRLVTHADLSKDMIVKAGEKIRYVTKELFGRHIEPLKISFKDPQASFHDSVVKLRNKASVI